MFRVTNNFAYLIDIDEGVRIKACNQVISMIF